MNSLVEVKETGKVIRAVSLSAIVPVENKIESKSTDDYIEIKPTKLPVTGE